MDPSNQRCRLQFQLLYLSDFLFLYWNTATTFDDAGVYECQLSSTPLKSHIIRLRVIGELNISNYQDQSDERIFSLDFLITRKTRRRVAPPRSTLTVVGFYWLKLWNTSEYPRRGPFPSSATGSLELNIRWVQLTTTTTDRLVLVCSLNSVQ